MNVSYILLQLWSIALTSQVRYLSNSFVEFAIMSEMENLLVQPFFFCCTQYGPRPYKWLKDSYQYISRYIWHYRMCAYPHFLPQRTCSTSLAGIINVRSHLLNGKMRFFLPIAPELANITAIGWWDIGIRGVVECPVRKLFHDGFIYYGDVIQRGCIGGRRNSMGKNKRWR